MDWLLVLGVLAAVYGSFALLAVTLIALSDALHDKVKGELGIKITYAVIYLLVLLVVIPELGLQAWVLIYGTVGYILLTKELLTPLVVTWRQGEYTAFVILGLATIVVVGLGTSSIGYTLVQMFPHLFGQ